MADLPHRPSLEHLRSEARALQREPGFEGRLSDAQRAVARRYGFASWPRLKRHVEAVTRYARDPHEVPARADDDAFEFLRLACLVYGGDDRSRPAEAAARLRRDPSLARRSLHCAAAAGDAEAVAELVGADADALGGPFGWEPLLYAAYSRVGDTLPAARVLLEHGADPNAGYLWDGTYLFTALTGVFGYGEDAPNQPPHPQQRAFARLLLEAGADANDEQTIYNRHFRPDNEHIELLLEYGLGRPRRGPWPGRLGTMTEPRLLAEDALVFVADNDAFAERVELLLAHGVDPDGRGTQHPALRGKRPLERARESGASRIEAMLLAAGAEPVASDAVDDLLAACARGDAELVDRLSAHAPELLARHPDALIDAADRGNAPGVEQLARVGYDVNRDVGRTALHVAAYNDHRAVCELLVRLGGDLTVRDHSFNATPADWAAHAHNDELAEWLRPPAPGSAPR